ncbi:uncharacterized protein LOC144819848 [Lissotriton helveticus]
MSARARAKFVVCVSAMNYPVGPANAILTYFICRSTAEWFTFNIDTTGLVPINLQAGVIPLHVFTHTLMSSMREILNTANLVCPPLRHKAQLPKCKTARDSCTSGRSKSTAVNEYGSSFTTMSAGALPQALTLIEVVLLLDEPNSQEADFDMVNISYSSSREGPHS